MKAGSATTLLGVGIYSVPDAARLTRVPARTIRRWIAGYRYNSVGERRYSSPLWKGQHGLAGEDLAVGFLDLMEIRLVHAFREKGVHWKTIRRAGARASERFETDHPFCTQRVLTDGRALFVDVADHEHEPRLLELARDQLVFRDFILPFLKNVRFQDGLPTAWWPLGEKREVVIDPARSLGKPIVKARGVPTRVLADACRAEGSVERVAAWFEVDEPAVRDALEFESSLAA
ncbi:MAG: DUF433 domain-containing protein [Planctomycetes bacterium]|nr:DUF433 domain-containing protein [Planctomycetota bacterium]